MSTIVEKGIISMDEKAKLKPKMGRDCMVFHSLAWMKSFPAALDTLQTDHLCGFLGGREVVEYKRNKQQPSSQKRKWKEEDLHEPERVIHSVKGKILFFCNS